MKETMIRNLYTQKHAAKWAVVLLMTVLAVPLSAQAWVFLENPTGGDVAERQYFISHLPTAAQAVGWELVDTKEESDLYITTNITSTSEFGLRTITVELYNTETDEFIATNAMGYSIVEEMDEWNRYLLYELTSKAPIFQHKTEAGVRELTWSERLWGVNRYWLHFAPRVGGDLRFYSPMQAANTVGGTFDAGVQFLVQILPFMGIQAEVLFTMDFAPQLSINDNKLNTTSAKSTAISLMFPVVLMVTFRPDEWLIAPFGGVYVNIPLGQMKTTDGDSNYQWQNDGNWMGLGWTAGIEVGRKVGPGTLFTDIRYISDMGNTVSDNGSVKNRRTGVSLSLGYEFSLFHKKAKAKKTE